MRRFLTLLAALSLIFWLGACNGAGSDDHDHDHADGTHTHADGTVHSNDEHGEDDDHADHAHEEVAIGTFTIGDMEIEAAQGHGAVEAGKESHLVIKLPYTDNGQTMVRAWIGVEDRNSANSSRVQKAEYAASHDDYDVHVVAPAALVEGAAWWIEIEKPDGTKTVGSFRYLTEDDLGE